MHAVYSFWPAEGGNHPALAALVEAVMNLTPQQLITLSRCFKCIPTGRQISVIINLLDQWSNNLTASVDWKPASAVANWDDSGGNHNGDLATFLATADLASVITLTLNGVGLTSLTGLQFLPALQFLDCGNNSLTSLDASTLAALTNLSCGNNSISSLTLTGCASLNVLDFNTNPLPGVDAVLAPVAGTVQQLNCASCGVNSINLPALTAIQQLEIQGNPITALDCSAAAGLTSLNISSTNIALIDTAGVDLSPAPLVTLRALNCDLLTQVTAAGLPNGSLLNPNFSNCDILFTFDCNGDGVSGTLNLSNCPTLNNVLCSNNPGLTTLTLTGCTALSSLNCNSCDITGTLNASLCPNLTSLICDNNPNLTGVTLTGLVSLTTFDCAASNILGTLDVTPCTSLVQLVCDTNPNLTGLNLTGITSLQILDCGFCGIGPTLDVSDATGLTGLSCAFNTNISAIVLTGLTLLTYLDCQGCVILSGITDLDDCISIDTIFTNDNGMQTAGVNADLASLVSGALTNAGTADLSGTNQSPTLGINNADKLNLEANGWSITVTP